MNDPILPKKLVIIDGKSVFYRGYYAMPNLSTKDGTPTGGVYGFAIMALEVMKRLKPDYVAIAWDKPKTNIRKRLEMYPQYKAGRKPPPADFYEQILLLHQLLEAFGWPLYELDDYEADDIMGALAVQAEAKGIETILITSDLDILQLISPLTKIYILKTGLSNIELYSPESFKAKYQLNVDQFLDLKALKGDTSDNIPGVPGIGEKTAIDLLKNFNTLDEIYENLGLIKDSTRKKLEAGKELAYLSKKIGMIWVDAPIKLNLKEVDGSHVKPKEVLDVLQKLEFRNLIRQLPDVMQIEIDKHTTSQPLSIKPGENVIIDTDKKLDSLSLKESGNLFVYSRSAGKHGTNPQLLMLSSEVKTTYCIDLTKVDREKVRVYLDKSHFQFIGYDIKATLKLLLGLGCTDLPPVKHDVLLGGFLLNSLRREKTLTELAQTELGYEGSPLDNLDNEELCARAPEIIAIIARLYEKQAKEIRDDPKLLSVAQTIDWPIIGVLARMEYQGILLNTNYLKKFHSQIIGTISDLEQQIYGHANREFNISSPAQLAETLFGEKYLALSPKGIKKGKTGYSTAAAELDKLRGIHPIIDLITQYRELTKLNNTYVEALPRLVDDNSRLHTTFNLTVAQTGRLSSTDPNLQNIPVRTDLGKRIRTSFEAGKGNSLISADYSQFELRIAAYLSDDKDLIEQFNKDIDVHAITASQIYNCTLEDVTKTMRRDAKVVNFGIMYGVSAHGLVAQTDMTYEQAQNFIKRYFEVRPKLKIYIDSVKEKALKDGYVETLFGRRRPTPDVKSSNFILRESAMRAAVNMPFQGSAADIIKMAMIQVDNKLRENFPDAKMLLQIHDSLIVECAKTDNKAVAQLLKTTMEQAYKLPIKLTVDVSVGDNWGEL
jgi:DNA polymerase-1